MKEQALDPDQWKYFQHGRLGQVTSCLVNPSLGSGWSGLG